MYKQRYLQERVELDKDLLFLFYISTDARCSFCGKVMTKPYSLLQHIGTCHNQILNYVPPEVHKQLTQLGVKDQGHE